MRSAWIVILSGALIVSISMGVRQTFGLFLRPVTMDLQIGREVFGLALAIQGLVWGLASPFAGAISDRYGTGLVLAGGGVLFTAGMLLASVADTPLMLYLSYGILIGLALGATTFGVIFGAVGRVVSPERRSAIFGLVGAGGSFGQFVVVPVSQGLIGGYGWVTALVAMAGLTSLMIVFAAGLAGRPATGGVGSALDQTLRDALREAWALPSYRLLVAGFFVCGFHLAFVGAHLPAYLRDAGLPAETGAQCLALIGLFNMAGSYLFGVWGGRHSKKNLLAAIYFGRALLFAGFFVFPLSQASALVFAAGLGFLWLGTVPLTSGLVAHFFGLRHMSMLYGLVFVSHQVGGFVGAWLGGRVYDLTGNYDAIWYASMALGLAAAVLHWPIREVPVARLMTPRAA
jgi:predicted MFS family arabinose efflux permease